MVQINDSEQYVTVKSTTCEVHANLQAVCAYEHSSTFRELCNLSVMSLINDSI